MPRKIDLKKCRYGQCKHVMAIIDIAQDEYVVDGRLYYHKDCYEIMKADEQKVEKTKNDMKLIRNMWVAHISNTVVFSQLNLVLSDLLKRGIESDYLVFVLQYCIEHKLNLNYPNGFPYFVDMQKIKDAYKKKKLAANAVDINSFVAIEEDTAPKFTINKKPSGFQSILKKNS